MSAPDVTDSRPWRATWRMAALRSAAVCGATCVVVVALLVAEGERSGSFEIQDDPEWARLQERFSDRPSTALRQEMRRVDLKLRRRHVRRMEFTRVGAYVLAGALGGLVLFVGTAVLLGDRSIRPPGGRPAPGWQARSAAVATIAVVVAAAALVTTILYLSDEVPVIEPTVDLRWPRFRGPGGSGTAPTGDVPRTFDGGRGRAGGILWKRRLDLPSKASVIGWGNVVFATGAVHDQRKVYGFSAATGRPLWETDLPPLAAESDDRIEGIEFTGYAACTPCTDGQRVYALFTNGDLYALDFSGNVVWHLSMGIPSNTYGHAASLLTVDGMLLVPFDQAESDPDDEGVTAQAGSRLIALDGATGKVVWEIERDAPDSWVTPIVIDTPGGRQIVTAADPWVVAYDPSDGEEIWRAELMFGDVAPSPVYAGGRLFVTMENAGLFAIDPTGEGNVTDTHVAWESTDALYPDITSPLAVGPYVLVVTSNGLLQCFSAGDGTMLWEHDYDQQFHASPSLVGGDVLLIADSGTCYWLTPDTTYRPGGTAQLGEGCVTTPAFGAGRIYLRGTKHLFCIGTPEDAP